MGQTSQVGHVLPSANNITECYQLRQHAQLPDEIPNSYAAALEEIATTRQLGSLTVMK